MRLLNTTEYWQVTGGHTTVGLTIEVPDGDLDTLADILGELVVGQLNATILANALISFPGDFNTMKVKSITLNNFTIIAS